MRRYWRAELPGVFIGTTAGEQQARKLGHSTVVTTMRYTHANLDSKRNPVAKLEGFDGNLVTPCTRMQQRVSKMSPKTPAKTSRTLYLKTEEWQSG